MGSLRSRSNSLRHVGFNDVMGVLIDLTRANKLYWSVLKYDSCASSVSATYETINNGHRLLFNYSCSLGGVVTQYKYKLSFDDAQRSVLQNECSKCQDFQQNSVTMECTSCRTMFNDLKGAIESPVCQKSLQEVFRDLIY